MPKKLENIRDAIDLLGGPSQAAKTLHRSRQTIYNWAWQNCLPPDAKTIREFEEAVKDHGGRISRQVLNPGLFA